MVRQVVVGATLEAALAAANPPIRAGEGTWIVTILQVQR
jgi:hypothetical protein